MRIRVLVDVCQPLKKEKKVRKPGGEWRLVKFKYGKLGTFCFFCGCLGHSEQFCEIFLSRDQDDRARGWGVELRAELRKLGGAGSNHWMRETRGVQCDQGFWRAKIGVMRLTLQLVTEILGTQSLTPCRIQMSHLIMIMRDKLKKGSADSQEMATQLVITILL